MMTRPPSTAGEAADLLLETLRLHAGVDSAALKERWAAVNAAGLAALAEYEGCVIWLHRRLKELRLLEVVPADFAQWLATRAHYLAAWNLLVDAQRDDLVRILNELQVPHVLLKGAARRLLADRYPYADARTTSDVDVLVPAHLALPTWERLRGAGFAPAPGRGIRYDSHFHLPPLQNGRAVKLELHTSVSRSVAAPLAWHRIEGSAQVVQCKGGPTRVPAATELLWNAITHAPLPRPHAFRIRFFQDATVVCAPDATLDWQEMAARLGSGEIADRALARRWLGSALLLSGIPDTQSPLGPLPPLDLSHALRWRLTVFRQLGAGSHRAAGSVWGPHPVSRIRRLLIDEATRAELSLPLTPPRAATPLDRVGRRVIGGAARLCYRGSRVLSQA